MTVQAGPGPAGMTLRDYARVLWSRKWTVLVVAALTVGGVEALTVRQDPVYQAAARVEVPPPPPVFVNGVPTSQTRRQGFEAQEAEIIDSPIIASRVVATVGLDVEPESLVRRIGVDPIPATSVIRVSARDADAERVAAIANGFVDEYLEYRHENDVGQIDVYEEALRERLRENIARLAELPEQSHDQSVLQERQALLDDNAAIRRQLSTVAQVREQVGAAGQVLERARPPEEPVSPDPIRNGVLALALGLLLGAGGAFLVEYVRDSLASPEEVEQFAGAPVLGLVPVLSRSERETTVSATGVSPALNESLRTLRTNLQFVTNRDRMQVIAVTSPSPEDGKTLVAVNLALALTQVGYRVVLVDGDLRRPRVHRMLGVKGERGLSTFLSGDDDLAGVVVKPRVGTLRVIPSGPIPANPTELLAGPEMGELVDACRGADLAIVDTPPVVGIADASVIASLCDGVLLVIDQSTGRRLLRNARDQLTRVGARIVGVVVNRVQTGRRGYYYSYESYGPEAPAADARPATDSSRAR